MTDQATAGHETSVFATEEAALPDALAPSEDRISRPGMVLSFDEVYRDAFRRLHRLDRLERRARAVGFEVGARLELLLQEREPLGELGEGELAIDRRCQVDLPERAQLAHLAPMSPAERAGLLEVGRLRVPASSQDALQPGHAPSLPRV
jgi:hypothetical protein